MPLLTPETRVLVTYRGKHVAGFVSGGDFMSQPLSRYVVCIPPKGFDRPTYKETLREVIQQTGLCGWRYIYVRRDDLERGALIAAESALVN
jgi:hypothetical protein